MAHLQVSNDSKLLEVLIQLGNTVQLSGDLLDLKGPTAWCDLSLGP